MYVLCECEQCMCEHMRGLCVCMCVCAQGLCRSPDPGWRRKAGGEYSMPLAYLIPTPNQTSETRGPFSAQNATTSGGTLWPSRGFLPAGPWLGLWGRTCDPRQLQLAWGRFAGMGKGSWQGGAGLADVPRAGGGGNTEQVRGYRGSSAPRHGALGGAAGRVCISLQTHEHPPAPYKHAHCSASCRHGQGQPATQTHNTQAHTHMVGRQHADTLRIGHTHTRLSFSSPPLPPQ